LKRLFYS